MALPIVRYVVLAILLWLSSKGVITKDSITDAKVAEIANDIIFWSSVFGAIVWSWLEKKKILPPNVSINTGSPTSTITLQPNPTVNPTSTGTPETK